MQYLFESIPRWIIPIIAFVTIFGMSVSPLLKNLYSNYIRRKTRKSLAMKKYFYANFIISVRYKSPSGNYMLLLTKPVGVTDELPEKIHIRVTQKICELNTATMAWVEGYYDLQSKKVYMPKLYIVL